MENGPAASRKSFGRRGARQASRAAGRDAAATPSCPAPAAPATPPDGIRWIDPPDPELEDWKRSRRWRPPWRQISFTASLCFGAAALVLPDTVSDAVQWGLYALAAASFWTGLYRRSRNRPPSSSPNP